MTVVTEGKTLHIYSFSISTLFQRAFVFDLYFLSNQNKPETLIGIAFWIMVSVEYTTVEYTTRGRCTWKLLKCVAVTQVFIILSPELNKTTRSHGNRFFNGICQGACLSLTILIDFLSLI